MPGARARGIRRAALCAAVVVAADQASKAALRGSLERGETETLVPGVLDLVHVRNTGIAFGALAGGGAVVLVIVVAALVGLCAYFAAHADRPLVWLPTGLLLGGALGNVVDRVRDGAVTDFLKLPAWPAFNVADMSITFGVVALLIVLERGDGDRRRA